MNDEDLHFPSSQELAGAVKRDKYLSRFRSTVRSTFLSLVVVAAAAVLAPFMLALIRLARRRIGIDMKGDTAR